MYFANRNSTRLSGYLVFSSTVSFYGPLTVMVFTYVRVYRAAAAHMRNIRAGAKVLHGGAGELRIHRGGGGGGGGGGGTIRRSNSTVNGTAAAAAAVTANGSKSMLVRYASSDGVKGAPERLCVEFSVV